jgi:hypothetical protein
LTVAYLSFNTRLMRRFAITGPRGREQLDYDWLTGDGPLHALHQLHAEALGNEAVRLVDGGLVFRDPADQEKCSGSGR